MDPFTHAVLGGAVAGACCYRSLGRKAIVAGALVALVPDVDVFYRIDEWSSWRYHRGITHSLAFAAVAGPLLGLLARAMFERGSAKMGAQPYMLAAALALLSHPLLDLMTSYGTQLLAPFSDRRFAIDAIAIIDPLYTLPLAAAVLYALLRPRPPARAGAVFGLMLALTTAYLGATYAINAWAEGEARRQLAGEAAKGQAVHAYPTIFQSLLRRLVVRDENEIRIGYVSILAPRRIQWRRWPIRRDAAVAALAKRPEGRLLAWFAGGHVFYRVKPDGDALIVEGHDLRYGAPGAGRLGLWGIRARLDAAGNMALPPHRFRDQPPLNVASIKRLWAGVVGAPGSDF